jgi:hypothetical protein
MISVKKILTFLICILRLTTYAQNFKSCEIYEVKTDHIYLNFIIYDNNLYIGTNSGAININAINEEKSILTKHKGYVRIEKNNIVGSGISAEYKSSENVYNYLLPEKYRYAQSRYIIHNKKLYIINSSILFVFKQTNYIKQYDSLSIRSISKNYIGSYNGIFKKGTKLKLPEYTDGNIREFENETFICFGGLYRDSSGVIMLYINNTNGETQIGNVKIGSARDILKLNYGFYALATNTGIYLVNFTNNSAIPVYTNPIINEFYNVFQIQNKLSDKNRFYYTINDKIYYYSILSNQSNLVIDTKQNTEIKDVYANNLSNLYVLYENKLSKYVLNNKSNSYIDNIYKDELSFSHNLAFFNDILFITTNIGAHAYDLQENKFYLNIFNGETNKRSLFVSEDTLKFGTPNGIISLTKQDIKNIINEQDALKLPAYNVSSEFKTYIIYFLIGLIFLIIVISNFFFNRKIKEQAGSVPDNVITKENIVKYIHENIKLVTIQSICEKFGVTPVRLYELLENDKPGEIIRNHRLNLVRRYRKEKKDDAFIAENTGFSISYLKKIY